MKCKYGVPPHLGCCCSFCQDSIYATPQQRDRMNVLHVLWKEAFQKNWKVSIGITQKASIQQPSGIEISSEYFPYS